jgi:hypothetical protein
MKKNHFLLLWLILWTFTSFSQEVGHHDYYPVDTIYFEYNTLPYQIVPSGDNCWQVGQPSKAFFNEAFSPPLAIVTDTLNPYPVNSNSSFTFTIPPPLVQTFTTFFQFYQKYDTDTIQDYGTVEASYDGGSSWSQLKDSICPTFWQCIEFAWEPDYVLGTGETFPHMLNPSGHSQEWIRSRFYWWWTVPVDGYPAFPDSIMVRFTFHSDATPSTKEGWMIDNILVGVRDEGSGIDDSYPNRHTRVNPNPLTGESKVSIDLPYRKLEFSVYDLTGKNLFSQCSDSGEELILERSDFRPGVYLWTALIDGKAREAGKLVVK